MIWCESSRSVRADFQIYQPWNREFQASRCARASLTILINLRASSRIDAASQPQDETQKRLPATCSAAI